MAEATLTSPTGKKRLHVVAPYMGDTALLGILRLTEQGDWDCTETIRLNAADMRKLGEAAFEAALLLEDRQREESAR